MGVRGALDRRGLGPGDRLRLARGPRREEDIQRVVRPARHRLKPFAAPQERRPLAVLRAQRQGAPRIRGDDHRPGCPRLDHVGIERQPFPAANDHVLREHRRRAGDAEPRGDLAGAKAVGDAHHHATGLEDAEINRDGFRRHRHDDRHRVAGPKAPGHQARGDAVRQRFQLADAHGLEAPALRLMDDRRGVRRALKTALHRVEPRARQPARRLDAPREVEQPVVRLLKSQAQPLDRRRPVRLAVPHGPGVQRLIRLDAGAAHEPGHVGRRDVFLRRRPGGPQRTHARGALPAHRRTPFTRCRPARRPPRAPGVPQTRNGPPPFDDVTAPNARANAAAEARWRRSPSSPDLARGACRG